MNNLSEKIEAILSHGRQILEQGGSIEEVLLLARQQINSKLVGIKIVVELLGLSPGRAKALVHHSLTWQDMKERDEQIEELMLQAWDELAQLSD